MKEIGRPKGFKQPKEWRVQRGVEQRKYLENNPKMKNRLGEATKGKTWEIFFGVKLAKKKRENLINRNKLGQSKKTRLKLSQLHKRLWKDPKYAINFFKKLARKPNKDELYLNNILKNYFPNEWKYVGDGKIWIDGRNPDFINNNGKKIVIEYNGFRLKHTKEYDRKKTLHYKKYGFKTINIYPKELKNEKELVDRIKMVI